LPNGKSLLLRLHSVLHGYCVWHGHRLLHGPPTTFAAQPTKAQHDGDTDADANDSDPTNHGADDDARWVVPFDCDPTNHGAGETHHHGEEDDRRPKADRRTLPSRGSARKRGDDPNAMKPIEGPLVSTHGGSEHNCQPVQTMLPGRSSSRSTAAAAAVGVEF